jgi:hypothetical protein
LRWRVARLRAFERALQSARGLAHDRAGLGVVDPAHGPQPPPIALAHRRLALDGAVHPRLGEGRLVPFVVSVSAVAVEIDDHVAVEGGPILEGQAHGLHHRLGVFAVDVEDRRVEAAGHVGGVAAGARVFGVGGEPDLVVDDHVERPARAVAGQRAQVQDLLHHALAGEGGVAVDDDPQHAPPIEVPGAVLFRPHAAQDHGTHDLEVAGVEAQRQVHAPPGRGHVIAAEAHVVLDVAAALLPLGIGVLELLEDATRALAEDVGENVEPAAMGHADHHVVHAAGGRLFDGHVEERDQALAAFEREALRPQELSMDEGLEDLGVGQLAQDAPLLIGRQPAAVLGLLHAELQPLPDRLVVDVHELDADRPAVRVAQLVHDRAQRERVGAGGGGQREGQIKIGLGEAVEVQLQLVLVGRPLPERIELGRGVAAVAIGAGELVDLFLARAGVAQALGQHSEQSPGDGGMFGEQLMERGRRDAQQARLRVGDHVRRARPFGDEGHLARDLAGADDAHDLARALHAQSALGHDEERVSGIAGAEHRRPRRSRDLVGDAGQHGDLIGGEVAEERHARDGRDARIVGRCGRCGRCGCRRGADRRARLFCRRRRAVARVEPTRRFQLLEVPPPPGAHRMRVTPVAFVQQRIVHARKLYCGRSGCDHALFARSRGRDPCTT